MASRRILTIITAVSACLLAAALGVMYNANSGRDLQPEQQELARDITGTLDIMLGQARDLTGAADLATVRETRQDLARSVLRFDQDLLALSEVVGGDAAKAVSQVQDSWRNLGLDLADLAAGEYAPSSAAGRETMAAFVEQQPAMRTSLDTATVALRAADRQAGNLTHIARTAAMVLAGTTFLLGLVAFWPRRSATPAPVAAPQPAPRAGTHEASLDTPPRAVVQAPSYRHMAVPPPRPTAQFDAHQDLTNVSASVDRVSVDMLTVARSTERMQAAVDSVVSNLQGMLFSLNEMAQDSHEGARITRTANNAAVYTADTTKELLDTAREMSDVMVRVRDLASRSQDVSDRIQTEAAQTGATGAAFTSVVAHEVKQLTSATAQSSAQIEAAVDEIMATQRQYENAIGEIIRNVSSVRKVAANLGDLMLEPPTRVQAGAAYQAPPSPQPAPQPVPQAQPQPQMAAPAPPPAPTPVPEPQAATPPPAPQPVLEPIPAPVPEPAPAPEAVAPPPTPEPLPEPLPEPAPEAIEDTADELAAATDSLLDELADVAADATSTSIPAPATEAPAVEPSAAATKTAAPSGDNGNVFMLNKPKKKPVAEAAPEPEPVPEPVSEPEPEAVAEPELEPAPEPEPEAKPEAKSQAPSGDNGNVFMLNKPKKKPAAEAAPEPEPVPEPELEPEPEPEPAPEPESETEAVELSDSDLADAEEDLEPVGAGGAKKPVGRGNSGNIFMLNKKK